MLALKAGALGVEQLQRRSIVPSEVRRNPLPKATISHSMGSRPIFLTHFSSNPYSRTHSHARPRKGAARVCTKSVHESGPQTKTEDETNQRFSESE